MKQLILVGAIAMGCSAFAQINPLGEFTGDLNEGFESFQPWATGISYGTASVMQGHGELVSNPQGSKQMLMFDGGTSFWGLGSNGMATPHSGNLGCGLEYIFDGVQHGINVDLNFDTGVTEFGGYFATVYQDVTEVRFYDSAGDQLGNTQLLTTLEDHLVWLGWGSNTPFTRINFSNSGGLAMDDLQANSVPEPVSLVVLGLGSLVALRRRRRA